MEAYDVVVIGAGKAGKTLAWTLPKSGRRVAIVEKGAVGGTCINVGCIPTKAMVKSAAVFHQARHASEFGVDAEARIDLSRVQARKRDISAAMRGGNEAALDKSGCDLIRGLARFVGPHEIEVRLHDGSTRTLQAPVIVIDTGARSAVPRLEGIETVPFLDSTTLMDVPVLPDHLVILGGGVIGVEFAQMFARFGSRVTVVQRQPQLLPREDADVAEALAEALRKDGVELLLGVSPVRVERNGEGVRLWIKEAGVERAVDASHFMAATGRVPETEALNLPAAGIATDDKGFIKVDERLQTSVSGVYAVGDCNGGPQFTHVSYDDFRVVLAQLEGNASRTTRGRLVPYAVFTDPQLGRVGLSEREAREKGIDYALARIPMAQVFRAKAVSETAGLLKILVDPATERILGAAALAAEGAEIMAVIQTAMLGGLTWRQLHEQAIYAHPTFAEALNIVFANVEPAAVAKA